MKRWVTASIAFALVMAFTWMLALPAAAHDLRRGDAGFDVLLWQRMLNRMTGGEHHDPADILVVDGIFGSETERMTKRFERGAKFRQDGIVTQRERRLWLGAFVTCCGATKATLAVGSFGVDVGFLQNHLNEWFRREHLTHQSLVIDLYFGPLTEAAVRTYQAAKDLHIDGIVGRETWGDMLGWPKQ